MERKKVKVSETTMKMQKSRLKKRQRES